MPSTSKKQHNFMAAVANNPKFAKQVDVPQSVGREFTKADKKVSAGNRADLQSINKPKTDHGSMALFNRGGTMKPVDAKKNPGMAKLPTAVRNKMGYMKEGGKTDMAQDKALIKKAVGMHDKQMHMGKKTDMAALKKGGMMKKMAPGGMAQMPPVDPEMIKRKIMAMAAAKRAPQMARSMSPAMPAQMPPTMKKGGKVKKMSEGGSFRSSAEGINTKGKTKGTIVKMASGGKSKKYC